MLSLALVAHQYMYGGSVLTAKDAIKIKKGNNAFSLLETPARIDNMHVQNVDGAIVPMIKRLIH